MAWNEQEQPTYERRNLNYEGTLRQYCVVGNTVGGKAILVPVEYISHPWAHHARVV